MADEAFIHVLDASAEVVFRVLNHEPDPSAARHLDLDFGVFVVKMINGEELAGVPIENERHDSIVLKQDLVAHEVPVDIHAACNLSVAVDPDFSLEAGELGPVDPHLEGRLVGSQLVARIFVI